MHPQNTRGRWAALPRGMHTLGRADPGDAVATHYEVLGVDPGADTETIRKAYVMVAKATHPDRRQADDPERAARAAIHIRLANSAWNTLRDPERRAEYDRSLRPPSAASTGRPSPGPPRAASMAPGRPPPPS